MGGTAPLVIQSMTNTNTNDIEATVNQCIHIFDRGAHMVRITTQSLKEVESLRKIREILKEKNYWHPLVADVHFQPKVALEAAKIVEKVRINPGNYLPRKYEGSAVFDKKEQNAQIKLIRERLLPLIDTCKKYQTAIRIGVNHGSLSERILNWYGDTPQGMVESALEFLKVFHQENFHQVVVSLKASSTRVMVQANRLLVKQMGELNYGYPIHLGVTEAGDEEEGRIKSAVGICSLLADGIGDTLRVSLTEEPEEEIPAAIEMARLFPGKKEPSAYTIKKTDFHHPFTYNKRISRDVGDVGGKNVPVVINSLKAGVHLEENLEEFGYSYKQDGTLEAESTASDYIFLLNDPNISPAKFGLKLIRLLSEKGLHSDENIYTLLYPGDRGKLNKRYDELVFLKMRMGEVEKTVSLINENIPNSLLVFDPGDENPIQHYRQFLQTLEQKGIDLPVILNRKYSSENTEKLMIRASAELGSLFIDGYGDGIWIEEENPQISVKEIRDISFNILQACSARISKTEYISCPSCGRTLFNIQSTLKKVKKATAEFTGLKIAVMGCIVNGPGEMADSDFGYVGSRPGKVSLYKGREEVMKNIPEEQAVEELLKLIRNYY